MAENDDVPGSPDADVQPATEPTPPPADTAAAPGPVLVTRWRDRAWSFRAMIAVALASLLIGGVGGSVLVAATDDDHDGHYRMGPYGPGGMMPPGMGRRMPRNGGPGGGYWQWQNGPNGPQDNTNPEAPTPVLPTPGSTS
jgi:hypothetical protein